MTEPLAMTRRVLNLLAALSLLLCVAALALWVRSYRFQDQATLRLPGARLFLAWTGEGRLCWHQGPDPATPATRHAEFGHARLPPGPILLPGTFWERVGFRSSFGSSALSVVVPIWLLVALTAAPPAAWFYVRSMRLIRRAERGLCPACGYDLRATPGQCPECGRVPPQRRATGPVASAGARPSSGEANEAAA